MNILCSIHARGGSSGIKNKNIKLICSKPLITHTIDQAKKVQLFSEIVVSTDSLKIQKIAIQNKVASWFLRNKKLSSNHAAKILAIRDTLIRSESFFKKNFDIIVDLDATSPLRNVADIKNALIFFKKKSFEILFSVCDARKNPYFNMIEVVNNKVKIVKKRKFSIVRRQDAPKVYEANASIYIWKRDALLKNETLFTKKTGVFVMPVERSMDIDNKLDFEIVSYLMKKNALRK